MNGNGYIRLILKTETPNVISLHSNSYWSPRCMQNQIDELTIIISFSCAEHNNQKYITLCYPTQEHVYTFGS